MQSCEKCSQEFETIEFEKELLKKLAPSFNGEVFEIPFSKLCPACRSRQRIAFRNERNLYKRKCDFTGEDLISIYSPDKSNKVYKTEIWWTDSWDPLAYGRDYDFTRPFFEQFSELVKAVPRMPLTIADLDNSPYVNQCWHTKNSYMCFDMGFCEDSLYSSATYHSKNVTDCYATRDCELSYNLIDCHNCYGSVYLQNSKNCSDSYFCFDCQGCNNIAFCSNFRNKNYQIFNKSVSKEEFEEFRKKIKSGSYDNFNKFIEEYKNKVFGTAVHKSNCNINTESCVGDHLSNSKNCVFCFDCDNCRDIAFCNRMDERIYDSAQSDNCAICELAYECMCVNGNRMLFCTNSYNDSSECLYCDYAISSSNCFGCSCVQHKKYCILNKQYGKEEYEKTVNRIIKHMKTTGEWGRFFDFSVSPFGYNETVANDFFPLSKEGALQLKANWKEKENRDYLPQTVKIPDSVFDTSESILKEILACGTCGKNYRLVIQELQFYKKLGLPIPRNCFSCRHQMRINLRNPRRLWEKECSKCGSSIQTSYSPERKIKVYCEKCYLAEVY